MYYVFQSLMCAWPVVLFFHCVSFLRLLTSKCEHEQIMVNTWRCWLWQWSMQAHACLSCMCIQEHLFVFCSGRFWTSPSQFLGNTKKQFLTHTRLHMQLVWDVVTPSCSLLFSIFPWGYTSAFSSFCGNTSQTFTYFTVMWLQVEIHF